MDLWLANPYRTAPSVRTSVAALDMLSPRPNPLLPPDSDDEFEEEVNRPGAIKITDIPAARGPFDLPFAVGASLALWALIALIVVLIFF